MENMAESLSLTIARLASAGVFLYLGAGMAVVLVFYLRGGLARFDPATVGSSFFFRLLILPGLVALWPWLLIAARRREQP